MTHQGATYSFISFDCAQQLNLPISLLPFDLIVSTPTNNPVTTSLACLDCQITIENINFFITLVCLPLTQIDVIIGMDWLSPNHVLLDCSTKTIIFNDPKCSRISSSNQTITSLWEETQGYVSLSSMEVKKGVNLEDIPIVRNFPEIFKEIPGLPTEREIEFSIDLMPGTGPISIAPYLMSPSELAELKKQRHC